MEKTYKCYYSNCQFGGRVSASEAVQSGKSRYHKSCLQQKDMIAKIREYYFKNIKPSDTIITVNKVINVLIFDKKVDADFLYFVLTVIFRDKLKIHNAFGLYYYVNNFKIIQEYENHLQRKQKIQQQQNVLNLDLTQSWGCTPCSQTFEINENPPKKGWGKIYGGDS